MGEGKHTAGPWRFVEREVMEDGSVYPAHLIGGERDLVVTPLETDYAAKMAAVGSKLFQRNERNSADARLIAAAPDHAAIAAALCSGIARWERTEFCIDGLRHSTKLDEFGVPIMTAGMRAAITRATAPMQEGE